LLFKLLYLNVRPVVSCYDMDLDAETLYIYYKS